MFWEGESAWWSGWGRSRWDAEERANTGLQVVTPKTQSSPLHPPPKTKPPAEAHRLNLQTRWGERISQVSDAAVLARARLYRQRTNENSCSADSTQASSDPQQSSDRLTSLISFISPLNHNLKNPNHTRFHQVWRRMETGVGRGDREPETGRTGLSEAPIVTKPLPVWRNWQRFC